MKMHDPDDEEGSDDRMKMTDDGGWDGVMCGGSLDDPFPSFGLSDVCRSAPFSDCPICACARIGLEIYDPVVRPAIAVR